MYRMAATVAQNNSFATKKKKNDPTIKRKNETIHSISLQ